MESAVAIYSAWKVYKYASAAYTTYKTVMFTYNAATTVASTGATVINYFLPEKKEEVKVKCTDNDEGWTVVDKIDD